MFTVHTSAQVVANCLTALGEDPSNSPKKHSFSKDWHSPLFVFFLRVRLLLSWTSANEGGAGQDGGEILLYYDFVFPNATCTGDNTTGPPATATSPSDSLLRSRSGGNPYPRHAKRMGISHASSFSGPWTKFFPSYDDSIKPFLPLVNPSPLMLRDGSVLLAFRYQNEGGKTEGGKTAGGKTEGGKPETNGQRPLQTRGAVLTASSLPLQHRSPRLPRTRFCSRITAGCTWCTTATGGHGTHQISLIATLTLATGGLAGLSRQHRSTQPQSRWPTARPSDSTTVNGRRSYLTLPAAAAAATAAARPERVVAGVAGGRGMPAASTQVLCPGFCSLALRLGSNQMIIQTALQSRSQLSSTLSCLFSQGSQGLNQVRPQAGPVRPHPWSQARA